MLDGILRHQDSNGGGLITDGDTQWMTAGAGLSFCYRWIAPLTCADDHSD
jgi:Pirin